MGVVHLVHPFPSALAAGAAASLAMVAGGSLLRATTLGLAMLLLQFSIGALNDVADRGVDAISQPTKPIPAGAVPAALGAGIAVACACLGLGIALWVGPPVAMIASLGLLAGVLYDLGLKGTAWSWVPFAAGLALIPVFAWVGAQGRAPAFLLVAVPLAMAAGAALAVSNALRDVERDRAAGVRTLAVRLGARRAWLIVTAGQLAVGGVVALSLLLFQTPWAVWLIGAGAYIALGAGLVATGKGKRGGWEMQALGLAGMAIAWFGGLTVAGLL